MASLKDVMGAAIAGQVKEALTKGCVSTEEVAAYLGVHKATAWRYLKRVGYTYDKEKSRWVKKTAR